MVFDAGYHALADGLHYFYFGTGTGPTLHRFLSIDGTGVMVKTLVHPRVSNVGEGLYLYSSVAETDMPYDVGYLRE